jgi:translation initiation factor IF-2
MIQIPTHLTVRELAETLEVSPIAVIKELMNNGIMASINQTIDYETAAIVSEEMGFEITPVQADEAEDEPEADTRGSLRQTRLTEEDPADLQPRPPVVTVLGHVDHGKTTLLDAIRSTNVVTGESGGITQHIGAYQIQLNGRPITFLDTPGHAAFTAMRARGAMVTDVVILVVAADDSVMPQTKEAISHARAADVPIIVALNKVDKDNANPEKVKQDLANENLVPEEWGGDTICVPMSAVNRIGVDDLLENILLTAEVSELTANPNRPAEGTVIESEIDKRRGIIATLLVQNGTLKQGDTLVIGKNYGRIRAMFDDKGNTIKKAGPSTPVSIMGLSDVPAAGDYFEVVKNRKIAEQLIAEREEQASNIQNRRPVTLEDFISRLQGESIKQLNVIIKADVQGSLEPIASSLKDLGDAEHKVRILHQSTGNITESDISLAVASDAIVIGFHVAVDGPARSLAEVEKVDVRTYSIIYKLIEDIDLALRGLYEPVYEDRVLGHARVKATFRAGRGTVAGCQVIDGRIVDGALVRVVRNRKLLLDSTINSLRRYTDDVREVGSGMECGIGVNNFSDFQEGDILEAYVREQVN